MNNSILERLAGNLTEYKSIPFWSWNDNLKPEHLRKQINEMNEAGIGGFFMHARGGLTTEYMGEDWMNCIGECVDEAKKLGMHAWAYDENGWPSGFAGMKLLEDPANYAHYIVCKHTDCFDPRALGCYRVINGILERVTDDDGMPCESIYDLTNDSVVDILNWKIVRAFIEETHEKYYKRYGKDFGNVLMGFFTDEPQYYRWDTAYTPVMLNRYQKKYNEDMLDSLGALFLDCDKSNLFRYRYWLMMNDLYTEAFAGQIFRWCSEHNCRLTGHSIEESSLFGNMMCSGGVMPFYEYEHIPGMDWLGRGISNEMSPRQVSSVAMQLGKKHVLTETYAGCGWDVTPRELKHIAEWQYVHGVNLMCQHLYPYSIKGQRKRDYPAFYSNHNPWTKDFRKFNDYFTRLGYMLAESREMADTVVIHPIHSAYFIYDRNHLETLNELDRKFVRLVEKLGAAGIVHHYADESLMARYGSVKGKKLVVGKCSYSTVVVPDMVGLDESTLELLTEFVKNGGKLYFDGAEKPHLISGMEREINIDSNITFDEIVNAGFDISDKTTSIRLTVRRSDFGDFVYAVNLSGDKKQSTVFHINAKGARRFDAEELRFEDVYFEQAPQGGINIPLNLEPWESVIIFLSSSAVSAEKPVERTEKLFESPEAVIDHMDDNNLTLDTAALSYDGEVYTAFMPVMCMSDRLLRERTNRTIYVKYRFTVNARPKTIRLEAEDMNGAEAWMNGVKIVSDRPGTIEEQFKSYDIADKLKLGVNELVFKLEYYQPEHTYKVFNGIYYDHDGTTESVLNCLSYYTDIEAVYLRGDFCVECARPVRGKKDTYITDGDFAITIPRRHVTMDSLFEDGYPFFGGSMTVNTEITATGKEKYICLNGHFSVAKVRVNGGREHFAMFDNKVNVEGELREGMNVITITLTNSMRNILGVFHDAGDPDPYMVGPDSDSMYGSWKNGETERYRKSYSFVFFGLNSIGLK